MKYLDDNELAENTLIVYTSDNGPENTWKKRIELYDHHSSGIYKEGKRSIYEGGHRVPFLVRWPKGVKAGSTWNDPVCQTDLLATFAEMIGADLPDKAGEDSVSFYAALSGEEQEARAAMVHHGSNGRFAVRNGDWKLIMPHKKLRLELYNVATDKSESTNVLAKHPEIAAKLEKELTGIVANGRSTKGKAQPNDGPKWWSDLSWIIEK